MHGKCLRLSLRRSRLQQSVRAFLQDTRSVVQPEKVAGLGVVKTVDITISIEVFGPYPIDRFLRVTGVRIDWLWIYGSEIDSAVPAGATQGQPVDSLLARNLLEAGYLTDDLLEATLNSRGR